MAERLRETYIVVDCPLEGELLSLDQCKQCEYFLGIDKATDKVICAFDETFYDPPETGCFCGGEFEKISENEWRCNKCGFVIVEKNFERLEEVDSNG